MRPGDTGSTTASPRGSVASMSAPSPSLAVLPPGMPVMYIVHMKRYGVAQARSNLSRLLDAAEAGDAVVIERRGTRFRLETDRGGTPRGLRRTAGARSIIEYVDPAVVEGQWTWEWAKGGLRFTARRRRR